MNEEQMAKQKGEGFTQMEINIMKQMKVKVPDGGFLEKVEPDATPEGGV